MKAKLGALLRAIRSSRHITIKEVAGKAGVSSSLLSQIERNRISPSLDTLLQILEVYGVTPDKFFKDYETNSRVEIIKRDDRKIYQRKGFKYEKLCGDSQTRGNHSFNAFFLELAPGQLRGDAGNGHLGRELGIVVKGSAQLVYGEETYEIQKGDSVSFFSQIPHVIQNSSDQIFQAYWVVTPADGEDYFGEKTS
ncbi:MULTISPECIES: helix-turn-helix domain-containing protein [Desulfobacula]|uniref:Transcriptional regulator, XRE family n=2 Tax=Desulfobacula TaxID=28222 RepID=K0NN75_DESTT|nr:MULTISPECIES: XRE family transcriptional regulator [Desulfobacula]CCK82040.1 transcriptional regulator, XRE family [Desulfobacula toluolica Tol2]SDU47507.1 transcriptional regulator, XRE family with cupin sensor [Desulfobacula phenolica]